MKIKFVPYILIASFAFLFLLNLFYPRKIDEPFVPLILSITTFLFSIFVSFSISDRHKRLEELRENDSIERSQLTLLHYHAQVFGKDFQQKMDNAIDNYLMAILDHKIWDFHKTENYVKEIHAVIISVKPTNDIQKTTYGALLARFSDLLTARRKTIGIIPERLSKFEWFVATVLPLLILASIVLIETNSLVISIISSLLGIMIVHIMLFLFMLDNFSWKEEQRIFEPYQKTFEDIEKLRYYPEILMREKRVKNYKGKKYRVGIFPNSYPNMSGKEIKIIDETKK